MRESESHQWGGAWEDCWKARRTCLAMSREVKDVVKTVLLLVPVPGIKRPSSTCVYLLGVLACQMKNYISSTEKEWAREGI